MASARSFFARAHFEPSSLIRGQDYSQNGIEAAWRKAINRRLSEDKVLATKVLQKSLYINIVRNMWGKALLKRHRNLPDDWINRNEVF